LSDTQTNSVLILGASSGFGEAAALEFARAGYDVYGVHLDRRAGLKRVEEIQAEIESIGQTSRYFNINAASPEKRVQVLDEIAAEAAEGSVRVLMHSLAFGTLRKFIAASPADEMGPEQMDMTLTVMAHSLVYWTQGLVARDLMGKGGRVYAMTSSGGDRVIPSYGAVSAAKASLESHCRQLALELAPRGITANAIRAGVTDTPALRKIPGAENMIAEAERLNPYQRLTTPEDVARCMVALADERTYWMTGNTIRVDGGEDFVVSVPS
jgi:enoyl-[acyl-carrier protein] reductase III